MKSLTSLTKPNEAFFHFLNMAGYFSDGHSSYLLIKCLFFFPRDCVGEMYEPLDLPEFYHKLSKHHSTCLSLLWRYFAIVRYAMKRITLKTNSNPTQQLMFAYWW